jgi:enamine deaminase RidA (YjgF/YER057c/UK114 family)
MSSPLARYSHGVEVAPAARLVFVSGQLGILPDGTVPFGIEAQAAACFENIARILAEAGMSLGDLVRINAYVTDRAYLAGYMKIRDRYAGTPPPASTLMIVSGFARVEFIVEVEAVAARPAGAS